MTQKIVFPSLALFCFYIFGWAIPLDVYETSTIFISLVGAVACAVLLNYGIFSFIVPEYIETDEEERKIRVRKFNTTMAMVAVFIVLWIFFGTHVNTMRENELKEYGVFTTATVIDGSSHTGGAVSSGVVTFKFLDKSGKSIKQNIDVGARKFNDYSQGQKLYIVYSSQMPSIFRIIENSEDLAAFTGKKSRDIALDDLKKLLDFDKPRQIREYLDSVNPEWEYEYSRIDSSDMYLNNFKQIGIKKKGNLVSYMLNDIDPEIYKTDIEKQGFDKIETDPNDIALRMKTFQTQVYQNDEYILAISAENMQQSQSTKRSDERNYHTQFSEKMITMVSVMKK